MSYRSISVAIVMAAVAGLAAPDVRAASKTYKKPATVPAVRVVSTTGPSNVMPVPTDPEIAEATKFVRSTLKDDYKATTPAKRREVARDLLRQGVDTRDNAAARYVLLADAAEMAATAGDATTASRAVDELARTFQIDPVEMKVAKLGEASKAAFTKEAVDGLFACCLTAEEGALVDERYEPAERLVTIAELAAERAKRVDLKSAVTERRKELDALRAGAAAYAKARDALATLPGDPAANLAAGQFLCLVKGDWDKGLPLLAGSGDEVLHGLAVKDMENPTDPGARAQVGGGWWDLAGTLSGVMKGQARKRAIYWYRQAAPRLTGVSRKAVDDRLREVEAERMRDLNLAPGLIADMYDGLKFDHKRVTRVDPQIDFEWAKQPADGMPADNFSIAWSGLLNVPRAGRYTFVIIANNGAALDLDGTNIFNRDDMGRTRKGERVVVSLDEGLHPFRLRFWDTTGIARIRLLWVPPGGASTEEPIPADAFCHEGGELAQVGSIRR